MNSQPVLPTTSEFPYTFALAVAIVMYVILGFAAYGAYKNLGLIGKLVYVMLFPLHWLLLSVFAAIAKDHRFISVPLILILGGTFIWYGADRDQGGWPCPTLIVAPVLIGALTSSGKWDEKKKFFE